LLLPEAFVSSKYTKYRLVPADPLTALPRYPSWIKGSLLLREGVWEVRKGRRKEGKEKEWERSLSFYGSRLKPGFHYPS